MSLSSLSVCLTSSCLHFCFVSKKSYSLILWHFRFFSQIIFCFFIHPTGMYENQKEKDCQKISRYLLSYPWNFSCYYFLEHLQFCCNLTHFFVAFCIIVTGTPWFKLYWGQFCGLFAWEGSSTVCLFEIIFTHLL